MKVFKIENKATGGTIMRVILHNPPYENKNILNKTGLKEEDIIITEVYQGEDNDND